MDLSINLAIMSIAIEGQAIYEPAREGWAQKLEEIEGWADQQIKEVQDFGEFYDEEV